MSEVIEVYIRFEHKRKLNVSSYVMSVPNYSAIIAKALNQYGLSDEMVEFRVEEKNV